MKPIPCAAALLIACLTCRGSAEAVKPHVGEVRAPAFAGQFYPAGERELRLAVEKFLRDAVPARRERPVAVIAPHAGYIYSGQIAADAFRQARDYRWDLVVILGTNHTAPHFRKIAVHPGSGFRTPLGVAEIDAEAASALLTQAPDCVWDGSVHAREHSIEVQVPFVQVLFPRAKILPVVVGEPDLALCERFGEALARVVRGRNALIVASSDLSHYPSAAQAAPVDRKLLESLVTLNPAEIQRTIRAQMARGIPNLGTCACGEAPILAALAAARSLGATRGVALSYANSGDSPVGESDRVVGYGAVSFSAGPGPSDTGALAQSPEQPHAGQLTAAERKALLAHARETIERFLTTGTVPLARGLPRRVQGAFVTLKERGQLRGCIGRMDADGPLGRVVGAMALQAALRDPRFPPVTAEELPRLEIEISALTPMRPVRGPAEIVVGRDGVLLRKEGRSAVFLPQVAVEQGWTREELLDNLCRKAGLPAGSWKDGAQFLTFQAEVFGEGT